MNLHPLKKKRHSEVEMLTEFEKQQFSLCMSIIENAIELLQSTMNEAGNAEAETAAEELATVVFDVVGKQRRYYKIP